MKNSMIQKLTKNKTLKDYVFENGDVEQLFVNTGSLVLNILFSGRLFGGIPFGKISQIAAPSSLGKCARGKEKFKLAVSDHKYEEIKEFLRNKQKYKSKIEETGTEFSTIDIFEDKI